MEKGRVIIFVPEGRSDRRFEGLRPESQAYQLACEEIGRKYMGAASQGRGYMSAILIAKHHIKGKGYKFTFRLG